jgi:hypothetical protein
VRADAYFGTAVSQGTSAQEPHVATPETVGLRVVNQPDVYRSCRQSFRIVAHLTMGMALGNE